MTRFALVVILLASAAFGQDKNCWRVLPTPPPRPVTFWTVHRWQEPPLRTNRQTLLSPWFLIPHGLALAATIVDYRRQHTNGPVDAFVPLAVVTAMDYGSDRVLWRPYSLGGATYIIVRHSYGAASGNYP